MATYEFGSYAYEDHGYITDHPEAPAAKLRTSEPAGVPGLYTGGGIRAAMRMSITGVLVATGVENLIELWRDLVAAHEPGVPQALYLEDADRYLLAEVESGPVEVIHNPPLKGAKAFEVTFLVASPYWLAVADTNAALAHGGGSTAGITPAGRTYSLPRITLVVSAANGTDSITVENTTTGEAIVLTPANGATGTYVINCETKSISKDTVTPIYAYDGEFMKLLAAANTVDITLGAGVTLSSATITWRDRD